MLNPVFLVQNCMVTRVVAKPAKQQKSKANLLVEKKVQKNTQLSFWWNLGKKFNLGKKNLEIKFRRKVQICLGSSVANSVGTPLEFAAFHSGCDAKYSRASAFCFFFLSTTVVFAAVRTHFARKTPAFSC